MRFALGFLGTATPPSYTYNNRYLNTGAATSGAYTFSTVDLGAEAGSRFVVLAIEITAGNPIATVTIGGVAATLLTSSAGGSPRSAIYGLNVPTSTSATVVITLVGAPGSVATQCSVASYSLYNLASATPVAVANSTARPAALNANTLAGSIVLAIAQFGNNATGQSIAWTGVTERWDEIIVGGIRWSGADDILTTAETPRTFSAAYSVTPTNSQSGCLVVMR